MFSTRSIHAWTATRGFRSASKAPDATKVRVNFWSGPKAEMEHQTDGFWTFTTPPMAPGLHCYTVIVDGAEVSDPASTAYFGGSKWASAVEVPEAGAT
jgi:hypothetical protein